jgi:site-specific recombinase XerD
MAQASALACCRLRVKDVDFAANQIVVRDGKGRKDRVTMLPAAVRSVLAQHIDQVRAQHVHRTGARIARPGC